MKRSDEKFETPEGIITLSRNVIFDAIEKKIFLRFNNVHLTLSPEEFFSLCQELETVNKYIIDLASHDIIQKDPSGEEN